MYFDNVKDLNELKSAYKSLVMKNHPDLGGDCETMKRINSEHDKVFLMLKRMQNIEAKANDNVKTTTEMPEEFREVIEKIISINGITVELCGSWLWIGGDTKPAKDELKDAGFRWSRTKKMWYWHHAEDGSQWSRGRFTMDEIREKHGSQKFEQGKRVALTA